METISNKETWLMFGAVFVYIPLYAGCWKSRGENSPSALSHRLATESKSNSINANKLIRFFTRSGVYFLILLLSYRIY